MWLVAPSIESQVSRSVLLVGGWPTPLKNMSQLGWFFQIYGKSKKPCSKPPTNVYTVYIYIYYDSIHMCHGQKLGKRPMEIVITPFHRYSYGSKPWWPRSPQIVCWWMFIPPGFDPIYPLCLDSGPWDGSCHIGTTRPAPSRSYVSKSWRWLDSE